MFTVVLNNVWQFVGPGPVANKLTVAELKPVHVTLGLLLVLLPGLPPANVHEYVVPAGLPEGTAKLTATPSHIGLGTVNVAFGLGLTVIVVVALLVHVPSVAVIV